MVYIRKEITTKIKFTMKKTFLIILSLLMWGMAGQVCVAQDNEYNLYKANEYIEKYEFDKAMEYVNLHLQEYPKSANGFFTRMLINVSKEKYSNALADINNCIKYWKKNLDIKEYTLYWWRAAIYKDIEMYDKAEVDYYKAYKLALKSKDIASARDILSNRAELYYSLKEYDKSDADYKLMLKLQEVDLMAMIGLVRNMVARGEYNEAIELTNKCEKIDASYCEIYRFRMQAYHKSGETRLAIEDAFKYIKNSDDPREEYFSAIMEEDLDYAIVVTKQLITEHKDEVTYRFLLTTLYEWNDDYANAIVEYNKIEKDYGASANIYYYRAMAYYYLSNYSKALIEINKYIEMTGPDDTVALAVRAKCYEGLGKYTEAIEDINKQIELYPSLASAYFTRGWQYEMLGDVQSALSDYSTAITLEPDDFEGYYMRSRLYFLEGKTELSQKDANEVLARDTILINSTRRHYALLFLDEKEEAVEWIDSLIAKYPESGNYYEKACLLSLMGNKEEAISTLRTSFEMGYTNIVHANDDVDFNNIKNEPAFIALINEYKEKINAGLLENDVVNADSIEVISEVPMKKMYSGVYEVDCNVNGLPLKFIFDTGASNVSISSVEAQFMLKNGYLKSDDIKGKEYFSTATGEISEGTIIRLREIKIGDAVLRNIEASVVHNQQAPLLLGQSVLERFGTITIDNINSKLIIKQ
jgi:clan AA aspartic protease (TIGR02281 family)